MKPTSRQLARYEELLEKSIKASQIFQAHKKEIAKDCEHPEKYMKEYQWESDNGYGIQHKITGVYCVICGAEKAWKESSIWRRDGRIIL